MNDIIQVSGLSKSYKTYSQTIKVLENINLTLAPKKSIIIMGESGSGKSTLLNLMGGLDHPDAGQILIDGQDITRLPETRLAYIRNKYIGFIFQEHNLLTDFNAYQNIMIPYNIYNLDRKKGRDFADYLLNEIGLYHRRFHKIGELSGGEQQRIAIARALINKPALLLADEPTGNLDENLSITIFNLLHKISEKHETAVIVVTHSSALADMYNLRLYLKNHVLREYSPAPE